MAPTDNYDYISKDDVWQGKDKKRSFIKWTILFCVVVFVLLLFRAWQLQIFQGAYFKDLASGNRIRRIFVLPPRGDILDKNGVSLASNKPAYSVVVSPIDLSKDAKQRQLIYNEVKQDVGIDIKAQVETALAQGSQDQMTFTADINQTKALILEEKWSNLVGVSIGDSFQRSYSGDVSQLIGYIGSIQSQQWPNLQTQGYLLTEPIGQAGLESYYQSQLRGQPGAQEVEVDASGKVQKVLADQAPVAGNNLKLTLDYKLQQQAKQILGQTILPKGLKGSLVALDPRTGGVLAMVSLPDYDNNIFVDPSKENQIASVLNSTDQPMFNRAIAGQYPSGSTIKPVVASAALQTGVINENTTLYCGSSIQVPNQYDPSVTYTYNENIAGGYGDTDVKKALAKSVNVFFYQIGGGNPNTGFQGLGVENLDEYMKIFGLGAPTGIDLPQESSGLVPTPAWKQQNQDQPWYLGDTYNLSIGQGNLLVTPLQVARYTMALANGGTLYQPHLMDQILDPNGKVITTFKPTGSKVKISDSNLQIVREGMQQCVTAGSCNILQDLNITSAGKTGTAQDSVDEPESWFTVFAPYDNPKIVLTVMVENAGEGYDIAEPIANQMLQYWQNNQ